MENEQCNYSGELKSGKAFGEGEATLMRDKNKSFKGSFWDNELHGISKSTNSFLTFL